MEWIKHNYIEIIGACLALIYLILEIRQKWMMWVVGIVSSLLYVYINFEAHLYALTGLNGCYVVMSTYGLYRWKLAKKIDEKENKTNRITLRKTIVLGSIALGLFIVIAWLLVRFTDSPVPYADAFVASLSIVATWMAAHKIIEHWLVWIFVNYFTVGLYFYMHLYPTTILFAIYGTMSIVGWFNWKKTIKQ